MVALQSSLAEEEQEKRKLQEQVTELSRSADKEEAILERGGGIIRLSIA